MPKKKPEVIDIKEVDRKSSQIKLIEMLEKSGYRSRFLEMLAGKREN